MPLLCAGLSDIGKKRKTNQDAIYLNPEDKFFIVADGMGGHQGGDVAAQMAIEHASKFVLENLSLLAAEEKRSSGTKELGENYDQTEDVKFILKKAVNKANRAIKLKGENNPELAGMGTTLIMLLFYGQKLYITNVGDSRAYLFNAQGIYQLSRDHSLVQEKLNIGIYSREEAALDPYKNVLVRTVGFDPEVEADVFTYKVLRNDLFLLCSDGLHGKVSDSDILNIVKKNITNASEAGLPDVTNTVRDLVEQANKNGGNDNISIVIVLAQ